MLVYVCERRRMACNKVQSCIILWCTHMFGWIIILPLKPRRESSRRSKQTDKQEKKFSYTLLKKTRESIRLCASLLFLCASWCWDDVWFIILERVGVSACRAEVRMWCVKSDGPISSQWSLSNAKARIIKQMCVIHGTLLLTSDGEINV